jgi:hypothetical protein
MFTKVISSNKLHTYLFVFGLLYFCYTILVIHNVEPRWNWFPDVNDYKIQSQADLTSSDFYSPKPGAWFSPRPFTVPLFFKIADADPFKMVLLQKFTYCVCVISLLLAILAFITHFWLKIIVQYSLLFFFTWWNIVGWSNLPVSESLSISFMFLWFSSILFYYKKQSALNIIFLIASSFFLSFTRDTWPYIILLFCLLNIFISKFLFIGSTKKSVGLFMFSVCLFFAQNYTSNIGERYKLPVFNSLAGRVSKDDDYLTWFKSEGMPQGEILKKDFKDVYIDADAGKPIIYKRYYDSTYTALFSWVIKDGKSTYQKFLLTHPYYFFLQDLPSDTVKNNVFARNLTYYQGSEGFFVNADHIFPLFNGWIYLVFFTLLIFLFFKTKEIIYAFLIALFILTSINAIMSYNADSLEIQRHLFITSIILEFISLLTLLLVVNYICNLITKKRLDTL